MKTTQLFKCRSAPFVAAVLLFLLPPAAGFATPSTPSILASSTFDADAEGWRTTGDAQDATGIPTYQPAGGNPGGHLSATDSSHGLVWYWQAPFAFLGDTSSAYGGMLSFDLTQSPLVNGIDTDDVILTGHGMTLVFDTAFNPGTDWTRYSVPLHAEAGWLLTATGLPPTQAQFLSVLSALADLQIRGEFSIGVDIGGLDNVFLRVSQPALRIEPLTPNSVEITWPIAPQTFRLQVTENLAPPIQWLDVDVTPGIRGAEFVVTAVDIAGTRFFRLRSLSSPPNLPPVLTPIGNLSFGLGSTLTLDLSAVDPESNAVTFAASPLQFPLGATLNATSGRFTFTPSASQVGSVILTFSASDGQLTASETITITVTNSGTGITTLRGKVITTGNAPLANVRLVVGTSTNSSDANGNYFLNNLPSGEQRLLIDGSSVNPALGTFATVPEVITLIPGADNVLDPPIVLLPLDAASADPVTSTQMSVVTSSPIMAQGQMFPPITLTVPAGSATNELTGQAFNGMVHISSIPAPDLGPRPLPPDMVLSLYVAVQPFGVTYNPPASISFPNVENFPPGSRVDIVGLNHDTGRMEKVGEGQVTPDGRFVNSIGGVIHNNSWHGFVPFPPEPGGDGDTNGDSNGAGGDGDGSGCVGSTASFQTGDLSEEHLLPSYRSMGVRRAPRFVYHSTCAEPLPIVTTQFRMGNLAPPPLSMSVAISIAGLADGLEIITQPSLEAISRPARPVAPFGFLPPSPAQSGPAGPLVRFPRSFPTGRHPYLATITCYFPISRRAGSLTGNIIIQNETGSPFGAGWTLDGLHRLHPNSDGTLLLTSGDGSARVFTPTNATSYRPPAGEYSTLVRNGNGTFTRRMKDGILIHFDTMGRQTAEVDRNGNATMYSYDGAGRLMTIQDPAGLNTTLNYAGNGMLASVTDPAGRTTQFTHDAEGNLTGIGEPAGGVRLFSYHPGTHLLASQINQRGMVNSYEYDSAGRFVRSLRPDGSTRALQSSVTMGLVDPASGQGTFANPGPPPPLAADVASFFVDGNSNVTRIESDTLGGITRLVDPIGRNTRITRDANSNPTQIIRPDNAVRTQTYDAQGNLRTLTEQAIAATTTVNYEPTFNQPTVITDPLNNTTRIGYNASGNPIAITNAAGTRTILRYDNPGCASLLTSATSAAGLPDETTTLFEYDPVTCNLVRTIDPLGHTNSLDYDAAGNVIRATDAEGRATRYHYDAKNRLTKVIDATNPALNPPCGTAGVTCYEYDPRGNLTAVIDARGSVTRFEYDALDRQTATIDPIGRRQAFGYDANGNFISNTNRRGQVITFDYDPANQLIRKAVQPGTPSEFITDYRYDTGGVLDRITAPDNALLMTNDLLGRLLSVKTVIAPTGGAGGGMLAALLGVPAFAAPLLPRPLGGGESWGEGQTQPTLPFSGVRRLDDAFLSPPPVALSSSQPPSELQSGVEPPHSAKPFAPPRHHPTPPPPATPPPSLLPRPLGWGEGLGEGQGRPALPPSGVRRLDDAFPSPPPFALPSSQPPSEIQSGVEPPHSENQLAAPQQQLTPAALANAAPLLPRPLGRGEGRLEGNAATAHAIHRPDRQPRPAREKRKPKFQPANLAAVAAAPNPNTVFWITPTNGFWDVATNWSTATVPGPTNDVIIDVPEDINVTYRSGNTAINSLESSKAFVLSGGTLTVSNTVQVNNSFRLNGGTLRGAKVFASTNGQPLVCASAGNQLDGVIFIGDVETPTNAYGEVTIANGFVLNGALRIGNTNGFFGRLYVNGSQTVSGSGSVILGNNVNNEITVLQLGATLTLGSGITLRGHSGTIRGKVVNQGTILADTTGGSIALSGQPVTNTGTIESRNGARLSVAGLQNYGAAVVTNGAALSLSGNWTNFSTITLNAATLNLGGTFTVANLGTLQRMGGAVNITGTLDNTGGTLALDAATGTWTLDGGTIKGGAVTTAGGALLAFANNGNNRLDGLTLNGDLDLTSNSGSQVAITNGLTLNGTARLGTNTSGRFGQIRFLGSQTLSGIGTVVFGADSRNALQPTLPGTSLTIGPGITVQGHSGVVGYPLFGGPANVAVTNLGTILADMSGGTITLNGQAVINSGIIRGLNGGSVSVNNLVEAAGLSMSGGGTLTLNGTWGNTGTITATGATISLNGAWSNAGSINLTNVTLNLGGTFTLATLGALQRIGGTVNLTGTLDNTGRTLALDPVSGSWSVNGGTIRGGTVTTSGGARLAFARYADSRLDGVTVNGELDLTTTGTVGTFTPFIDVTITNGLVLNGTAHVGNTNGSLQATLRFVGSQTLEGNGTIVFGRRYCGDFFCSPNSIAVPNVGTTLTIGPGITVRGRDGLIGGSAANVSVINQGTILADTPDGTITLSGQPFVNQGTVQARYGGVVVGVNLQNFAPLAITNGATLTLAGAWTNFSTITLDGSTLNLGGRFTLANLGALQRTGGTVNLIGTLDNTGGTLALDAVTGSWILNGGSIRGGTVTTTGGAGLIATGNATNRMDGVTMNGGLDLTTVNFAQLTITNGLVLNGTARVGTNFSGDVFFHGSQTLSGSGTVIFGNNSGNDLSVVLAGTALTIGPGITIRGHSGRIGGQATTTAVTNLGTILAGMPGGTFTLAGQPFMNLGTVLVRNGATIVSSTLANGPGGVVTGDGTISGSFTNSGQFNPGSPIGTLTINGNFIQTAPGVLNLQVGGSLDCDQFDRLLVTGAATLDGTLNIIVTNHCRPALGQMFNVLTFGSRNGDFASASGDLLRTYGPNGMTLTGNNGEVRSVSVGYTYDRNGNRLTATNATGRLGYFYDNLNRLTRLTNFAGQTIARGYDNLSRRTNSALPNGTTTRYAYDAASQLTNLVHRLGGSAFSGFGYMHDKVGNRRTMSQQRGAVTVEPSLGFLYDNLDRLIQATRPLPASPPETFNYDPVGNRLRRDGDPADALFDAANRLLEDSQFLYAYDADGNLTNKTDKATSAVTRYTFDAENQLRRIDLSGGGFAEYRYDPLGRRIEKNVNGQLTRYVYDREDILLEFTGATNALAARYTHGPGIDEPLTMERDLDTDGTFSAGERYFYHTDGLGSITELTTSSGVVTQAYVYDSFGQIAQQAGTLANPYTYTGREFDAESGLYYNRARYLDARTGRFLSEDPYLTRQQVAKLYQYVGNNPVLFADPTGLFAYGLGDSLVKEGLVGIGFALFRFGGHPGVRIAGLGIAALGGALEIAGVCQIGNDASRIAGNMFGLMNQQGHFDDLDEASRELRRQNRRER